MRITLLIRVIVVYTCELDNNVLEFIKEDIVLIAYILCNNIHRRDANFKMVICVLLLCNNIQFIYQAHSS